MRDYLYKVATDRANSPFACFLKGVLFFLSLVYAAIVSILIVLKRVSPVRLGCKVISVGNITVGGTGKTPLVELVAGFLKSQGHTVAIISRGYHKSPGEAADEPAMLSAKLKDIFVLVDSDRIKAAQRAIREHAIDTAVFDDGLQQWHIKKDMEIVAIDASNPFGNGHLLPRGILRQPLGTLECADIFVITKTNIGSFALPARQRLKEINPKALIFDAEHKATGFYVLGSAHSRQPATVLNKKRVFLFSGIADPDSFSFLAQESGAIVAGHQKFADHHRYTGSEIDGVIQVARQQHADMVVTTEKDAVKLSFLKESKRALGIGVLTMGLRIKDEQGFFSRLRSLYTL